eukprot:scaffold10960_cov66-Phaeocystis_antarctica.AAC.6
MNDDLSAAAGAGHLDAAVATVAAGRQVVVVRRPQDGAIRRVDAAQQWFAAAGADDRQKRAIGRNGHSRRATATGASGMRYGGPLRDTSATVLDDDRFLVPGPHFGGGGGNDLAVAKVLCAVRGLHIVADEEGAVVNWVNMPDQYGGLYPPHLGAVSRRQLYHVVDAALPLGRGRRVVARVASVRDDHVAVLVAVNVDVIIKGGTAGVEHVSGFVFVQHPGPPGRARSNASGL